MKKNVKKSNKKVFRPMDVRTTRKLTPAEQFKQCLKEAEKLCIYDGFYPAVDDLDDDKIGHITWKVLCELDLYYEGDSGPKATAAQAEKAKRFLKRWVEFIEPEFASEIKSYYEYI